MSLEWFIARRYLASRRGARFLSLITLIAIGGVLVGVMALIIVTSVMTGLQTDLREKILGMNPHIWVTMFGEDMSIDGERWRGAQIRASAVDGVVAAAPFVQTEVGIGVGSSYAEAAMLRGIDPDIEGVPVTDISGQIQSGELSLPETASGNWPLLMGEGLAANFGAAPGTILRITGFQGAEVTPMGGVQPRMRHFEVVGTFRTGMYEYDNKFLYTTLEAAQDLTGLGDGVTGLEIRVADPMEADVIALNIADELGYPYRSDDWKNMNSALFEALQLEKIAMGIILLLIVVVAAFNIISTLVMVVTDKTREIGILKSMGLKSSQVQRVFMMQGLVIGIVGAGLGAICGLFTVFLLDRYELIKIPGEIYFIDRLPVAYDLVDISVILGASLLISFLATLYPARQAAGLYPVDAIRND